MRSLRTLPHLALSASLAGAIALTASPAAAEDLVVVSPGVLFSVAFCCQSKTTYGLGAELSASRLLRGTAVYHGAFLQLQTYLPTPYRYHRVAAGLQGGYLVGGLELGAAYQTASKQAESSAGLQLTPYVSAIVAWTGLRFTFPGAKEAESKRRDASIEWVLAAKLPVLASGKIEMR